uniref:C-type lectin domain-containing protein n=1 Tax=Acrobeloides nanus TaxID=290746 RepID=A0A914E704_9BILA
MFVQWLLMHHLINVEVDIVKKVYALAKEMAVIFTGPVFKDNVFIGISLSNNGQMQKRYVMKPVSCSVPNWIWDVPSGTLTLSQTNYSNWAKDEPGPNGGCKCVADRNSSNEDHGWRIANCTDDFKYFACMKPATTVAVDVHSSRSLPMFLHFLFAFVLLLLFLLMGYVYYRFVYQWNRNHNGRPKVDSCTSSTESGITEVTQKTSLSSTYKAICEKNLHTKSSNESMKSEEVGSSEKQFEEAKDFLSKIKLINNSLIDSNTNININVPKTSNVNINIRITD